MPFDFQEGMGVVDANGDKVGRVTDAPSDERVLVVHVGGARRLVPTEAISRIGRDGRVYLAVGLHALEDLPVAGADATEEDVRRAHEALGLVPRERGPTFVERDGVLMRVAGDELEGTPSYTVEVEGQRDDEPR